MDHQSEIGGMACAEARLSLTGFAEERLDDARRLAVRRHLLGCERCRQAGAALDPSIIFIAPALAERKADAAFWTGFDATLRSRLETEAARRRTLFGRLLDVPRLAYAAPVLVAAVLAGLMFFGPGGMFQAPSGPVVETIPVPRVPSVAVPAAESLGRGRRLPTDADEIASLPTLEEVSSPKARVYRLDVPVSAVAGGTGDVAAVYFVVDESINF